MLCGLTNFSVPDVIVMLSVSALLKPLCRLLLLQRNLVLLLCVNGLSDLLIWGKGGEFCVLSRVAFCLDDSLCQPVIEGRKI